MAPPPRSRGLGAPPPEAADTSLEERFRELAEHLDAIFWIGSPDNRRVLYVSPAFEAVFGRSCQSLYEDIRVFVDAIHPDDRPRVKEVARRPADDAEVEYRIVHPDGSLRWIHGRAFPVRNATGAVVRFAGISQDVTERKRLELQLRGRNRVLELLATGAPLESVLETLARVAEQVDPGLLCSVLLLDPESRRLRHGAAPSLPAFYREAIDGLEIGPGVGSCGTAAHTGRRVIVEDVRSHPDWREFRELAERAQLRACWSQPILASSGRVLGTLALYYREPRAPTPEEVERIENTARVCGIAIERFLTDENLRESQRNLADAQRIAHIGSWEWNIVRDRVTWSDELYRIAGLDREEFDPTYDGFLERVHPDDRKFVRERVHATLANDERYDMECRIIRPDGSVRCLWADGELIRDSDGEPLRLVGTAQDVTEHRRAEEERRGLEAQMRQSQQLESLGVLAGGIAHDFNNLLSVILGNSGLALETTERGSALDERLRRVRETAQYAAELVDQILTYSGKPSIELEPVDLGDLIEQMRALLRSSVSEKCELTIEPAAELPPVSGDPTQIRQILLNLVTNASEALRAEGGHVHVRTGRIEADASYLARTLGDPDTPPGEYVFLEVEDDGAGMDAATRSRVFDPFFTTKFSGRGLGLAAVLGIVRGHRGAAELDTRPGVGTRFRVLLPVAAEPRVGAGESLSRPELPRGSGTILAIDDELWVLDVAREFLERAGYRVITAGGGREGLERFRAQADEIDAVLLDLAMPDVGGPEAFEEIRRLRPEVPVILVSGYNQELAGRRFATHRATGFVRKPYEPDELVRRVHAVLGR